MSTKRVRYLVLVLIMASFVDGCASLRNTFDGQDNPKIYVGTRSDLESIGKFLPSEQEDSDSSKSGSEPGTESALLFLLLVALPIYLIDLPFSFVMDTVLLPYTIPQSLVAGSKQ